MTDVNSNYKLSRAWFDFAFENPDRCNPNHTALYMWILEKKNRLGHKEKFGLPTCEAMEAIGVKSKSTYYKTFNDLLEFGCIETLTKSVNQFTSVVIMLHQNFNRQANGKQTALDLAHVQQANSSVPIIKQTNQQTPKQINNIPPTFDDFNSFCLENGFEHIAKKAFDYYSGNGWKDNQNKKVKNWKLKLQSVWFDETRNPKPAPVPTAPPQPVDDRDIYQYFQYTHGNNELYYKVLRVNAEDYFQREMRNTGNKCIPKDNISPERRAKATLIRT